MIPKYCLQDFYLIGEKLSINTIYDKMNLPFSKAMLWIVFVSDERYKILRSNFKVNIKINSLLTGAIHKPQKNILLKNKSTQVV